MALNDAASLNAEVLRNLETHALACAKHFDGDPAGELVPWGHAAARRVALLRDVYAEAEQTRPRHEGLPPASKVAWEVLSLIHQNEKAHANFIETMLKDRLPGRRSLSADVMMWLRTMESNLLVSLTERPALRPVLSRLAARQRTPFEEDEPATGAPGLGLTEMEPGELFRLGAILSAMACQTFVRLETLTRALARTLVHDPSERLRIEGLADELGFKALDETIHELAFHEVAGWSQGGMFDASLSAEVCVSRIVGLFPRGPTLLSGAGNSSPILTDGGLGKLLGQGDRATIG